MDKSQEDTEVKNQNNLLGINQNEYFSLVPGKPHY